MTNLATVTQFQTKAGKSIEDFLNEKAKRSENTAKSYEGDINRFLKDVFEKTINTVTKEELEILDYEILSNWLNSYYEKVSNSTINRYYSSIKSLYKNLRAKNAITCEINFFDLFTRLPEETNSYEYMPREVVDQYIAEARKELHDSHEKVILIIMAADTALRQAELLNLEWSQFVPDGDEVIIRGFGKGKKKFVERISKELYELVLSLKLGNNKKVFSLSRKNIQDMMGRIKEQLGYEDRNYTFHSLKKYAVTFAKEYTGDIQQAQKKGKHSNINTTQIYLAEKEVGLTGAFSVGINLNNNLYKEVDHNTLLDALDDMGKDVLIILNKKLQNKFDKKRQNEL